MRTLLRSLALALSSVGFSLRHACAETSERITDLADDAPLDRA
jgi:hypothetical protein